jgi:BirA family biotin operon repressor/biotin-[acetyl-CoA-carboxylase] ligase
MDISTEPLSLDDLADVVARTFVQSVEYLPTHASTNDRALELARGETGLLPKLVLVDEQTAGRGRGANRWWSSPGALTFSLLIDSVAMRLEPAVWPRVSLAAGLAVCDAIDGLLGSSIVGLKWPNDVLADRRKLCGILVEIPPGRKDLLVLGIGVNVNGRINTAPAELQSAITSMYDLADRELSRMQVLVTVLCELAEKLNWLAHDVATLHERWQKRCLLTGRTVEVEQADRVLTGICRGIDHDGALLLATPGGIERCLSGVVRGWA